jgi:eukaryotic-like serine/threonine-protein kinase
MFPLWLAEGLKVAGFPGELSSRKYLKLAQGDIAAVGSCRAGDRIGGRYKLERLLGQGSSGQVWQAVQEPLGRSVAIKVLKSDAKGQATIRFMQEARIAGQLQSRYVVSLFDFGTTPQGQLYMVMEHLHGETLGERLARAPAFSVKDLLVYSAQALHGLAEVHAAGIVHRDLKPDNIFLVTDGKETYAKILDFGVSRVDDAGALAPDVGKLTATGMTVGTPLFMAPEQARGLRDQIDGRTDLYALGVILFKAITGKPPFHDANVVELLMAVVAAKVAPSMLPLRPEVPSDLCLLVQTAISPRREDRFSNATEMRNAIELIESHIGGEMKCRWAKGLAESEGIKAPPSSAPTVSFTDIDATMPQSLLSLTTLKRTASNVNVWLPWAVAAVATLVAATAVSLLLTR